MSISTGNKLHVQRSEWKGEVTDPKGGRSRRIPMTARLAEALQANRHLWGARVLCQDDGKPLTQRVVQGIVRKASRKANLLNGGVYVLRQMSREVPLGEVAARSGFQVSLESTGNALVMKLY